MKKLWREFRGFAFKVNVIDMAVGVMIGAAFTAIVTSLVNDVFMPVISLLMGRIDFSSLALPLSEGAHAASVRYGAFLQTLVNFLVITLCVFGLVKMMDRLRKQQDAPAARTCPYCMQPLAQGATRCPHCTSEVIEA